MEDIFLYPSASPPTLNADKADHPTSNNSLPFKPQAKSLSVEVMQMVVDMYLDGFWESTGRAEVLVVVDRSVKEAVYVGYDDSDDESDSDEEEGEVIKVEEFDVYEANPAHFKIIPLMLTCKLMKSMVIAHVYVSPRLYTASQHIDIVTKPDPSSYVHMKRLMIMTDQRPTYGQGDVAGEEYRRRMHDYLNDPINTADRDWIADVRPHFTDSGTFASSPVLEVRQGYLLNDLLWDIFFFHRSTVVLGVGFEYAGARAPLRARPPATPMSTAMASLFALGFHEAGVQEDRPVFYPHDYHRLSLITVLDFTAIELSRHLTRTLSSMRVNALRHVHVRLPDGDSSLGHWIQYMIKHLVDLLERPSNLEDVTVHPPAENDHFFCGMHGRVSEHPKMNAMIPCTAGGCTGSRSVEEMTVAGRFFKLKVEEKETESEGTS